MEMYIQGCSRTHAYLLILFPKYSDLNCVNNFCEVIATDDQLIYKKVVIGNLHETVVRLFCIRVISLLCHPG